MYTPWKHKFFLEMPIVEKCLPLPVDSLVDAYAVLVQHQLQLVECGILMTSDLQQGGDKRIFNSSILAICFSTVESSYLTFLLKMVCIWSLVVQLHLIW